MRAYVNHQAMGDLFRPIEHEPNPIQRAMSLKTLVNELASHVYDLAKATCYDLKASGWSTGQIADEIGLSERAVKRVISEYAEDKGIRNPLKQVYGFPKEIDVSYLVSRAAAVRRRSEETSHPTSAPE